MNDSKITCGEEKQSYLLFFSQASARLIPLPQKDSLFIAQEPEGKISINFRASGTVLAEIQCDGDDILFKTLTNIETILINHEAAQKLQALASGDVISIGDSHLVLNLCPRRAAIPAMLGLSQILDRLRQEIERCKRYQCPFSVLVLRLSDLKGTSRNEIYQLFRRAVRSIDIVGMGGLNEFIVVFPETTDAAEVPSYRLLKTIDSYAINIRGGLARCPSDGQEPDDLIASARNAALEAKSGELKRSSEINDTLSIGDLTIVAVDPKMKRVFGLISDLAASDLPVLITGETGVGKEVLVTALHAWSPRRDAPLVSINCAAVPETLLESELFGHERGAFSGAVQAKPGLLESAAGGVVFLDEISESSARVQAELLRVLDTKRVRRLGAILERTIDVRIVAATNRYLPDLVHAGEFREDLYYRIHGASLQVPPLRDRLLDLPALARHFLRRSCEGAGRKNMTLSEDSLATFQRYHWPGNIRQLKHLIENIVATVHVDVVLPRHLPDEIRNETVLWRSRHAEAPANQTSFPSNAAARPAGRKFQKISDELRALERQRMLEALEKTGGVQVRAAELIGMPLRTFVTKMKQYGLMSDEIKKRSTQVGPLNTPVKPKP